MQCSGQEYDRLVSEVVIKLWSYVSTSKDVEVISAALKYVNTGTLSLYKYFLSCLFYNRDRTIFTYNYIASFVLLFCYLKCFQNSSYT
jgi:hypothetical protein